jgi:hypothetical protein
MCGSRSESVAGGYWGWQLVFESMVLNRECDTPNGKTTLFTFSILAIQWVQLRCHQCMLQLWRWEICIRWVTSWNHSRVGYRGTKSSHELQGASLVVRVHSCLEGANRELRGLWVIRHECEGLGSKIEEKHHDLEIACQTYHKRRHLYWWPRCCIWLSRFIREDLGEFKCTMHLTIETQFFNGCGNISCTES